MTQRSKQHSRKSHRKPKASPFSTGGGGNTFEQRVCATALVDLLTGAKPSCVEVEGTIYEVRFQRRSIDGEPLDDLILSVKVPASPNGFAKVSLQVKHDIAWGDAETNDIFNQVIEDCWKTFCATNFNQDFDRFGVVVGVSKSSYKYYSAVLRFAIHSSSGEDFLQKINEIAAKDSQAFVSLMRGMLDKFAAQDGRNPLSDDEIWLFLRSFVLSHIDLTTEPSAFKKLAIQQLRMVTHSNSEAHNLWPRITNLAAEGMTCAGSYRKADVFRHLSLRIPDADLLAEEKIDEPLQEDNAHQHPFESRRISSGSETSILINTSAVSTASTADAPQQRLIQEERLDAKVDAARDLLREGRIESARTLLNEVHQFRDFPLSPHLQFRVAANLGLCALEMGEIDVAIEEHRKAFRQEPDNWKARIIGAEGELFAQEYDKAVALCLGVLEEEPRSSDAALVLIQALNRAGKKDDLEAFLKKELWIENDPSCCRVLSHVRKEQGDLPEAIRLLRSALHNSPNDPHVLHELASSLLSMRQENLSHNMPLSWRFPPEATADLEESIALFNQAIPLLEHCDNKRHLIEALVNRGAAHAILNHHTEALKDFQRVLSIEENEPYALMNQAWVFLKEGDADKVIATLSKVESGDIRIEAVRTLVLACVEEGKWQEIIDVLTPLFDLDSGTIDQIEYAGFLIEAYQGLNQFEEADHLFSRLENEFSDVPASLCVRAEIKMNSEQPGEAIQLFQAAVAHSTGRERDRMLLHLAEACFALRHYREAADCYRQITDETCVNRYLRHLAISLVRAPGGMKEALRLSRKVRGGGTAVPVFSEIEASVAEYVGDWKLAVRLRRELIELEPERVDHRLAAALMEAHEGSSGAAQRTLQSISQEIIYGKPRLMIQVAQAYAMMRMPGALELAYQARQLAIADPDIHFAYLSIFRQVDHDDNPSLWPVEVRCDCAVKVKIADKIVTLLLVLGRPQHVGEIGVSDPRAQALMGHKVGDTVIIGKDLLEERSGTIVEIQHKYLYAFQDSILRFGEGQLLHPSLSVGNSDPEEFLSQQSMMLKQHNRFTEEALDCYHKKPIPLSTLSILLRKPLLELWRGIHQIGGRFYASDDISITGHAEKLIGVDTLVLDPTAVFMVVFLGLEKEIKRLFPRLLVSHALWDELREFIDNESLFGEAKGYLWHDGLRIRYHEETAEEKKNRRAFIQRVAKFVMQSTDKMPVYSLINHMDWPRLLGKDTITSILLAKEHGVPLFSDDLRVRKLAETQYGVTTTYFYPILIRLRRNGLPLEKVTEGLRELVLKGYSLVSAPIDAVMLWLRATKMEMTDENRFIMLRLFGGQDASLEWASHRVAFLIEKIWKEGLLVERKRKVLHAVLEAFVFYRSTETAVQELKKNLEVVFLYDPINHLAVVQEIDDWYAENLRLIDMGAQLQSGRVKIASLETSLNLSNPETKRQLGRM